MSFGGVEEEKLLLLGGCVLIACSPLGSCFSPMEEAILVLLILLARAIVNLPAVQLCVLVIAALPLLASGATSSSEVRGPVQFRDMLWPL